MGKKYLDTKENSIESAVMQVWQEAAKVSETNKNDKSDDGEGLDAVQPKALKKKFKDRKDKDINNKDGVDDSDEYLHNRRKAVSKAMAKDKKDDEEEDSSNPDNPEHHGKKLLLTKKDKLGEGTKQVLAHGGKGQYKAVRDGSITKIMYKGKVVGTADFDRGADSFFVSMKGQKGQKSFDDAQAMVDYFAKNKITEELEMRDFNEYQNFKVESMRSAIEEVWATSADDKLFEDISLLSEEDYDDFLESLNEEELNELVEGIGSFLKRRFTTAGRLTHSTEKLAKTKAKQDKAIQKAADRETLQQNKAKTKETRAATKQFKRDNPGAIRGAVQGAASRIGAGVRSLVNSEGVDLDELTGKQKKEREASRGPEGREHGGISQTKGVSQSNDGNQAHRAKRGYYPVGSAKRDDFKPKPQATAALKKALQAKGRERGLEQSNRLRIDARK